MVDVLLQSDVTAVADSINAVWVLTVTFLIFFMQPGFALLEAGQVRAKNAGNVVMKNMTDWGLGVLVFFVVGAGISALAGYVTTPGASFDLAGAFAYVNDPTAWVGWLFGAVFAMTAATIVSGAVAERMKFSAYVVYAIVITAFIYPVISGFAWGGDGLLSSAGYLGQAIGAGYKDFAGATVVHALGGVAGLTAAYMVGPRTGRFDSEGNAKPIPGHSVLFAVIGTLILAFGWYGFNVGTQATVLSASDGGVMFMGGALGQVVEFRRALAFNPEIPALWPRSKSLCPRWVRVSWRGRLSSGTRSSGSMSSRMNRCSRLRPIRSTRRFPRPRLDT